MGSEPANVGEIRDESAGTLGALLYADRSRTPIPESEWAALVVAIAGRDANALRDLYHRLHRLVFTLAFRLCGSHATAEEVTVDVFHDVWRRADRYDPAAGTVIAWVMNQARSRALDRVRHDQRKKRVAPATPDATAAAAATDGSGALDRAAAAHALRDALALLTADERAAVEAAYFGERSYRETADYLRLPVGTVKTRIRSALVKLRSRLDKK